MGILGTLGNSIAASRKKGYQISSLYSPLGWVSWRQIAREFVEAKGNKQKLKVWINTRLGLPFEEKGDQPDWALLKARAEPYKMLTIPEGVQLLSAAVDVHLNRLEVKIKGWGYGEESWLIFYGKIFGDTERRAAWDQLDTILNRSFPHPDGHDLRIATMAVDSGNQTHTVYNYCRFRKPRVIAIKGATQPNKPVIGRPTLQDVNYKGITLKGGVQLWPVGTDSAKSTIYGRLAQKEQGPGYCHFPEDLEDDYFVQLTAEKLVTKFDSKGFARMEWVKVADRNEALDLEVYAYAAAIRSGIAYMDFLKPPRNGQPRPQKEKAAVIATRRKTGFVNRWKQGRLG